MKIMDALFRKRDFLKEICLNQKSARAFAKKFLVKSTSRSLKDITEAISQFLNNPTLHAASSLIQTLTTSGVWVSRSSVRYIYSFVGFENDLVDTKLDPNFHDIIELVDNDTSSDEFSDQDIFSAIYQEIKNSHKQGLVSKLRAKKFEATIVLVSGVLNEVFSSAAFERGVRHLSDNLDIKYFVPTISGIKTTQHNAHLLQEQITDYTSKHPGEKLWFIAFSKGGLDSLHFLLKNRTLAEKHIIGLSTIACPILGANHQSNILFKFVNHLSGMTNSTLYKNTDKKVDLLGKKLRHSLSTEFRENWFSDNRNNFPELSFYTSISLESDWHESHLWMILAKIFLQSKNNNDGVVDVLNAHFPSYFKSINMGTVRGHHLIGTRSSFYQQESLLEALVIFLTYKGKFN